MLKHFPFEYLAFKEVFWWVWMNQLPIKVVFCTSIKMGHDHKCEHEKGEEMLHSKLILGFAIWSRNGSICKVFFSWFNDWLLGQYVCAVFDNNRYLSVYSFIRRWIVCEMLINVLILDYTNGIFRRQQINRVKRSQLAHKIWKH